jgi:hypothetical protein
MRRPDHTHDPTRHRQELSGGQGHFKGDLSLRECHNQRHGHVGRFQGLEHAASHSRYRFILELSFII